jgi:hypothetical protein
MHLADDTAASIARPEIATVNADITELLQLSDEQLISNTNESSVLT